MRSVHTSHPCNFQDMWKWKSARPTTSQKLVTPLKTFPTPFYTILLLHQQVLVLWCLGTNCLLSWPHAINLRLRRVGVTDSWDFKMAVIFYSDNSASYLDVSLSLDENVRAKEGGKETKGEMYSSHGPLRFITSHSRFSLAIIICYSYSHHSSHNLYLVVSALCIVVFRLSRCGAPC